MSISDAGVIDMISTDRVDGSVILSVSDHLSWGEGEDLNHMWMLQEKLNRYLDFLEGGEISESYPAYNGQKLRIRVVGKYDLNASAQSFYEKAKGIISSAGYSLDFVKID